MKEYTQQNPPKRGNGRKIWEVLESAGYEISELHYNPNNFGQNPFAGWGTWACKIANLPSENGYFCGIDSQGVYLMTLQAPYGRYYPQPYT